MKKQYLLIGILLLFLSPFACIQKRTVPSNEELPVDSLHLKVNSSGYTSYDYYRNWRKMARILYEEQDSSSLAIYHSMVAYIEKIKNKELEISPEEVFVDLANSFRNLTSRRAQTRIDSLLVSAGYDPFYHIQPQKP